MITHDQVYGTIQVIDIPRPATESDAMRVSAMEMAREEILLRLTDRPFDDPEDILFQFMTEMFIDSTLPAVIKQKINPYLIAKDYAETILVMLDCPIDG